MTTPPRMFRLAAVGFAVATIAMVTGLFVGDTTVAGIILVIVSALIVVSIGLALFHRGKDAAWLRETWLAANAQPKLAITVAVFGLGAGIVVGIVGLAFVSVGWIAGWSLLLNSVGLVGMVAFYIWVALRPFDDKDTDSNAGGDSDAGNDGDSDAPQNAPNPGS